MKNNIFYYEKYKDMFGYYREIQKINTGFRLYFDKKNKKYNIVNIYNNFEICSIFSHISEINLENLRFSKVENSDKIFKYIDNFNQEQECKINLNKKEKSKYILSEFLKLNNRTNSVNVKDINKIIGAIKC